MKIKDIEKLFRDKSINTNSCEFFNSPSFISEERLDGRFLEYYGYYVRLKEYDSPYLNNSRKIINSLVDIMVPEFERENRLGLCEAVSNPIVSILHSFGVWSYTAKGSMVVSFDESTGLSTKYLCSHQTHGDTAHQWIVAPPFSVIDLTAKYQGWQEGEGRYIPHPVLEENIKELSIGEITSRELADPELITQGLFPPTIEILEAVKPKMIESITHLGPGVVERDKSKLKYIATAMSVPTEDFDLYSLGSEYIIGGLHPVEVFEKLKTIHQGFLIES